MAERHPARAAAVAAKRGNGKTPLRRSSGGTRASFVKSSAIVLAAIGAATGTGLASAGSAGARSFAGGLELIGLPPLYAALVAVANCPDLRVDDRAFAAAAQRYGLKPADFTPYGRYAPEVAQLAEADALRIHDNRQAFCSSARLTFAVVHGVLVTVAPP